MPRYARVHSPATVHHIIGRFVNGTFRLNQPHERAEYLRRLAQTLARTDWRVLAYALMSNHVHLACVAGNQPSSTLIKPTHVGFAQWLNHEQQCFGPLFAERHTTVVVPAERVGLLEGYLHNNVVRAQLVSSPLESHWTSHRAYAGLESPPPWLDRDLGLSLAGFPTTAAGRADFHEFVMAHRADARNPEFSDDARELRKELRRIIGAPIEVTAPKLIVENGGATQRRVDLLAQVGLPIRPAWSGEPEAVVRMVAAHRGVCGDAMRSRERRRELVNARRLALLVWVAHLGRGPGAMAVALGLSSGAASHLLNRDLEAVAALGQDAEFLAAKCWSRNDSGIRYESK
jgi:putative transposase